MDGASDTRRDGTETGLLGAAHFATTRWSLVVAAGEANHDTGRRRALAELCALYWPPVYAFARRRGAAPEDARDHTQEFFTRLLEREDLSRADASRGRFRSWLLACFKHFLANERARDHALKRGGGRLVFTLDDPDPEGRAFREPASEEDPERAFERVWAHTLLEDVVARLAAEYEEGGRAEVFESLRPALTAPDDLPPLREVAEALGTTEGAVKVAVHRLRKRFGELLRRAIADTVEDPAAVEDELRGLFEILSRKNGART